MKLVKKNLHLLLMGISGIFAILTSMGPSGIIHPIKGIKEEETPFAPEYKIVVSSHAFTPDESKRLLAHNLLRKGIVPLQIDIQNNTANSYSLCASSVDIEHINPKKVANQVARAVIPRLIAWRILGLFFWPFMIPGTIDSAIAYVNHRALKKDYHAKSLKEEGEVVAPYSTYHRVLFVPKEELVGRFDVILIDVETFSQQKVTTEIT